MLVHLTYFKIVLCKGQGDNGGLAAGITAHVVTHVIGALKIG